MDPRIALAFDAFAARVRTVVILRLGFVVAVAYLPFVVHRWWAWLIFGLVLFMFGGGAFALLFARREALRHRARFADEPERLTWLHTAPEPRSRMHRLELHDRTGETAYLFVPPAIASGVVAAVRELPHRPTVTTNEAERVAQEAPQRLAAKLGKLEQEAQGASAPKLAALRDRVLAFVVACRAAREGAPPPALEEKIDRLLHLYLASRIAEPGRKRRSARVEGMNLPADLAAPEHFTAEIATLVAEAHAALYAAPRE